jgi:serine/threonine-protein kinase
MVHRGGFHGRYVSSGHILYARAGTLFAVAFDLATLQTRGEPIALVNGIASSSSMGVAQFSVSDHGTLVYLPGGSVGGEATLSWVARGGRTTPLTTQRMDWLSMSFSPDGRHLAIEVTEGGQRDIVIHELATDTTRRLPSSPIDEVMPIWSADGRRIAYTSAAAPAGRSTLFWQRADGGGEPVRLLDADKPLLAESWHPGGKALAYTELGANLQGKIFILPLDSEAPGTLKPGTPRRLREGAGVDALARFSPDGRWISYVAESKPGAFDIYVQPYPGTGGRWQVSSGGGIWSTWSRKKQELLYADDSGAIWVVPYIVQGDTFRSGKPELWAPVRLALRSGLHPFDLHPDGERIVTTLVEQTPTVKQTSMLVIFNVFEVLRTPGTR